MNIYTTYTPSHKVFYDNFFLKTLPPCFNLNVFEDKEQLCPSGTFYSDGWTETTKKKVDLFVKSCEQNFGNYFFYCDVDVQFFDNNIKDILLEEIEDKDIACQNDLIEHCSGVFICKANDRTLKMFRRIQKKYDYIDDDQKSLNKLLHMCKHKKLSYKFFTTGLILRNLWTTQDFNVPKNLVLHHANWTKGIDNKIKLLKLVKQKYDRLQSI